MSLATSKLYGNDELHLPKIIKEKFKEFPIDKNTIFEWDIQNNDVIGMIKKEACDDGSWDIDKEVYE